MRGEISHAWQAVVADNDDVVLCTRLRCPPPSLSSNFLADSPRTASTLFHLPIEEDEDDDDFLPPNTKHISWVSPDTTLVDFDPSPSSSIPSSHSPYSSQPGPSKPPHSNNHSPSKSKALINEILAHEDCYAVLGISRSTRIDKLTLRRAYLARSKACHPECVFESQYPYPILLTSSIPANSQIVPKLPGPSKRFPSLMTSSASLRPSECTTPDPQRPPSTSLLLAPSPKQRKPSAAS